MNHSRENSAATARAWRHSGTFGSGSAFGALLTVPLVAAMYLGRQLAGLPFAPFELVDGLTRILPGVATTFTLDMVIDMLRFLNLSVADNAKTAEQIIALLFFISLGAVVGAAFFVVVCRVRLKQVVTAGLTAGLVFGFPALAAAYMLDHRGSTAALGILWNGVLFASWGVTLGWTALRSASAQALQPVAETSMLAVEVLGRRKFLLRLGGSIAAITVVGSGLGAFIAQSKGNGRDDGIIAGSDLVQLPNADDPVQSVLGARPEYTPLEAHYKVFIRIDPPVIDAAAWKLPVTGLVNNPVKLTLEDLRYNYRQRNQFVTLNCISGRIPTSLIGTTLWSGLSLQDLLADAQVQPTARYLRIISADGFHETVDLDLIASDDRIMLCYAWDGRPLPMAHGFPLRVWIPDRFGMKQPKWIWRLEVTDRYTPGYWVERSWDEVAQVRTIAVIDSVAIDEVQRFGAITVSIGGFAFAGDRGISRVEVCIDGNAWLPARLRSPLSETTWTFWRYEWLYVPGAHTFKVQCFEADGTPMITAEIPPRPSGATGVHRVVTDLAGA